MALALGHYSSVIFELPQKPWRFASGRLQFGALQTASGMAVGFEEHQQGLWVLALAEMGYIASVYYYGRRWERE